MLRSHFPSHAKILLLTSLSSIIWQTCLSFRVHRFSISMKRDIVRPSIDDVERISKGLAAKKRGTGSRAVPHRLNAAERIEWDLAKSRRFVILRGTGYRKERADSPLANVYRLYCDAIGIPCISLERGLGIDSVDVATIDFSPLRSSSSELTRLVSAFKAEAHRDDDHRYSSLRSLEDKSSMSALGWDWGAEAGSSVESVWEEAAVWRLPALTVSCEFGDRGESRRFVQAVARTLATGPGNSEGVDESPPSD